MRLTFLGTGTSFLGYERTGVRSPALLARYLATAKDIADAKRKAAEAKAETANIASTSAHPRARRQLTSSTPRVCP